MLSRRVYLRFLPSMWKNYGKENGKNGVKDIVVQYWFCILKVIEKVQYSEY